MHTTLKETHRYSFYWLMFVSYAVVVFGVTMLVAPALIRRAFSLLVFNSPHAIDTMPQAAVDYITLTHGVLGAVMAGWGVMMVLVIHGPLRHGSRRAWLTIAVPLAFWFAADTAFSLWSGAWPNAALNTALAAAFAVPLAATRRACRNR